MRGNEIRRLFTRFFEERGHVVVPSSSLVPDDPSLLLTTAGMVQFKPYFLGQQETPHRRAVSVQKSFRTTDIDLVGHTDRHLTFFEMLGNFSFGDYFKEDAIAWAWELVTEGFGLEPERLWATVFETDDEAADIWADRVGLPPERIVRRGKADNFWSMGVAGPCGPCSEIFVDRGPKHGEEGGPEVDEDRYLEIWNLVFMQDECDDAENVVGELPRKNIDTGSGIERVAIVLQDAASAFETDLMRPVLEVAETLAGTAYGKDARADVSLRILAEHGRATTFLIADGVLPSNEGRGYVLRRMLRRLVSHARRLGVDGPVTGPLVDRTVELMGDAYPELRERRAFAMQVASSEEEHFGATLRQGMTLFEQEVDRLASSGERRLPGDVVFRLHDTFGFNVELVTELAREHGLDVDRDAFERLMGEQRERARRHAQAGRDDRALVEASREAGPTEFLGYERLTAEASVRALVSNGERLDAATQGTEVEVLLERTPFYAEGGGQVGDAGTIRADGGQVEVVDTVKGPGTTIVHRGKVVRGEVRSGATVSAEVDAPRRHATARSHTGTHVLHWTLRRLLGEHARQAGSLVAPGRLRFDFTHFEALSRDALDEAEAVANERLGEDEAVRAYETTWDYARSQGAIALFEETYGDIVRVVEIGDYSIELCGGTHVAHTGEVQLELLVSEGSIGAGLRRVEALVGPDALQWITTERRLLAEISEVLGAPDPEQALERARRAIARVKELENELGTVQARLREQQAETLVDRAQEVDGVALVAEAMLGGTADTQRQLAQAVLRRLSWRPLGAVVLGTEVEGGKALLVGGSTKELVAKGVTASKLLEPAAKAIGGGVGGKPHLAVGGGPNAAALKSAIAVVPQHLRALLAGG